MLDNYSVISAEGPTINGAIVELCKEVRECIEHGWQPQGSALYLGYFYSPTSGGNSHVFCQTLVKPSAPIDNKQENA